MTGLVLGLGCRTTCSLATLRTLALQLLEQTEPHIVPLRAIGCWTSRQHHEGLIALARLFEVPLEVWPTSALSVYAHQLSHRSSTLYHYTGLWGIAEAAALASAEVRCSGHAPVLSVTRRVASSRDATGAVAYYCLDDDSTDNSAHRHSSAAFA